MYCEVRDAKCEVLCLLVSVLPLYPSVPAGVASSVYVDSSTILYVTFRASRDFLLLCVCFVASVAARVLH